MVFIMGRVEECRCYWKGQNGERGEEGTSWYDVPKEIILNKEGEIFPGQEWVGSSTVLQRKAVLGLGLHMILEGGVIDWVGQDEEAFLEMTSTFSVK